VDEATVITRLVVDNFKGFGRFSVAFSGDAYLVGPNNAGKSSLISALRFAAHMLPLSLTRTADIDDLEGKGRQYSG
jgi:predicted ATP-dependent endonuclease of OLD family